MIAWYKALSRSLGLTLLAALTGVTILLLGCENTQPAPKPIPTEVSVIVTPEPNFAFALEWTYCYSYTLNTFDNTLTLRSNMAPPTVTKIEFILAREELEQIYRKMVDIDFFSYPDEFAISLPPDVIRVYGIATDYRFDIRNGSQSKAVHWKDEFNEPPDMPWRAEDSEPGRTQAIRLRELIELIRKIAEAHPEFKTLPSPGGCA